MAMQLAQNRWFLEICTCGTKKNRLARSNSLDFFLFEDSGYM
jgi:hypothetical protein